MIQSNTKMQVAKTIKQYHNNFLTRFASKKLTTLGGVLGMGCGFVYLGEHYSNIVYNNTAVAYNDAIDAIDVLKPPRLPTKQAKKLDFSLITVTFDNNGEPDVALKKIQPGKNPFSMVIIPEAPFSVNLFTTGITGAVVGSVYATYWPITLPVTFLWNILTHDNYRHD